jgi:hypothetical protein
VILDYSEVSEFVLFEGQIVVVEGFNPSGSTLVAKRIHFVRFLWMFLLMISMLY